MTQDERKQVWDSMSKEEQHVANKEYRAMLQRQTAEGFQVIEKLKEEGKFQGGLDGGYPEMKALSQKHKKEVDQLLKKYGLR